MGGINLQQIILSACLVASSFAGIAHAQEIQVTKDNRTIAVTTTESASMEADVAAVTVGFTVYAKDAQTAYANGSVLSNAIMHALSEAGVPKGGIRSTSQNLTEQDQSEHKIPLDKQFQLSQRWQVKVKAGDAAKVLDLSIKAGANEGGDISWMIADADEDTLTARAAGIALRKAKAIADQMAAGLGTKVTNLIYASNQAPSRSIYPFTLNTESASVSSKLTRTLQPLAITPDIVSRSATVYAVFAIE